jgi:hypothetical protein
MAKSEILKTLDEETFDWIEYQKKKQKEKIPGRPNDESKQQNTRRQRFFHIRQVAQKEIVDLTRLAEILPEDQQSQIFNDNKLWPFLKALFNFSASYGVTIEKDELIYTPEAEARRLRLIKLCYDIISVLNESTFAELLAPTLHIATAIEGGALANMRAIYYESLSGVKRISVRKTGE